VCSSDLNFLKNNNGYTYIVIEDDNNVKLKNIYTDNLLTIKKSTSGTFNILEYDKNEDTAIIDITYNKYNIYSHSIFGVQLPEIKSKNRTFNIKRKVNAKIIENSLLINDSKTPLYYLFDLQIGKIRSPFIEISFNTFIFTQLFGILLNLICSHFFI
jgi:hypothetical protein